MSIRHASLLAALLSTPLLAACSSAPEAPNDKTQGATDDALSLSRGKRQYCCETRDPSTHVLMKCSRIDGYRDDFGRIAAQSDCAVIAKRADMSWDFMAAKCEERPECQTITAGVTPPSPHAPVTFSGSMTYDQYLYPGDMILSPGGVAYATFQTDGNFVVYCANTKRPVWSARSNGLGAAFVVLQRDANIVEYTQFGQPVWDSETAARPGYEILSTLRMQDDANLVLYANDGRVLWHTHTDGDCN